MGQSVAGSPSANRTAAGRARRKAADPGVHHDLPGCPMRRRLRAMQHRPSHREPIRLAVDRELDVVAPALNPDLREVPGERIPDVDRRTDLELARGVQARRAALEEPGQ
jgi:hypothetical protein